MHFLHYYFYLEKILEIHVLLIYLNRHLLFKRKTIFIELDCFEEELSMEILVHIQ